VKLFRVRNAESQRDASHGAPVAHTDRD
jgi:hypothetical protein